MRRIVTAAMVLWAAAPAGALDLWNTGWLMAGADDEPDDGWRYDPDHGWEKVPEIKDKKAEQQSASTRTAGIAILTTSALVLAGLSTTIEDDGERFLCFGCGAVLASMAVSLM